MCSDINLCSPLEAACALAVNSIIESHLSYPSRQPP